MKKSQSLPVNILVMIIIGIILFGISIALFNKFTTSSEKQVDDLRNQVKTEIQGLECNKDEYVCIPEVQVMNGKSEDFLIYLSNIDNTEHTFNVKIEGLNSDNYLTDTKCGSIKIIYPSNLNIDLKSGYSAEIPVVVEANKVSSTPCSFITTVKVTFSTKTETTPLIITVE